jgi:hypothetical protein
MRDIRYLQSLTETANRCAFAMLGSRDTCVLTSHALADVLSAEGAYPLRVSVLVFQTVGGICTSLGDDGGGTRLPASDRGMWKGHLAVAVGRAWLLDATLDQANRPEWSSTDGPLALPLPASFWDLSLPSHQRLVWHRAFGIEVRFNLYPKQVGFAGKGDARPSHWRPLADAILTDANKGETNVR